MDHVLEPPYMKQHLRLALGAVALALVSSVSAQTALLNVSYDVAREFYKDLNTAYVAHVKKTTGKDIKVDQSHAGSSAQARAVADGLNADVGTFNTTSEVAFWPTKGWWPKTGARSSPMGQHPPPPPCCFWCATATPKASKTGTT